MRTWLGVWAGLRAGDAGDAGNAEEELGVQRSTSAVYPTDISLALRARRHTAQLDFLGFAQSDVHSGSWALSCFFGALSRRAALFS